MAFEWQPVQPVELREPPGGMAPFVRIQYEQDGSTFDFKGELRGVEPVEEYGFDLGIRIWLRWGDYFEVNVNGSNVRQIFDDTRDLCLRVPSNSTWGLRVEVSDPEPAPPEEPEPLSMEGDNPTTGSDGEPQSNS